MSTIRAMDSLRTDHTLLVDGFSLSYCSDDLKRIFAPYGRIVWTRIVRDRMGMSLGFGYVAMASESEAHAAIEALNGKCVGDRVIQIVHVASPPLPRRV